MAAANSETQLQEVIDREAIRNLPLSYSTASGKRT